MASIRNSKFIISNLTEIEKIIDQLQKAPKTKQASKKETKEKAA